ncbi:hypothetical protein YC2023_089842 [Brassica napus]
MIGGKRRRRSEEEEEEEVKNLDVEEQNNLDGHKCIGYHELRCFLLRRLNTIEEIVQLCMNINKWSYQNHHISLNTIDEIVQLCMNINKWSYQNHHISRAGPGPKRVKHGLPAAILIRVKPATFFKILSVV